MVTQETFGILFFLSMTGNDGEALERPLIEALDPCSAFDENQVVFGNSMLGSLGFIKQHERNNVLFDMRESGEADDDDRAHMRGLLDRIEALEWPDAPNETGQYVIESIWAGPLSEEGIQYRFSPVL